MKPKVIAIVGPTASGKSDLAVQVARTFGCEIISADSRQVYKGLDIGTGKITKKEMLGIPHYLIDIASPKRKFSVIEWKQKAQETIEKITKNKKIPIIVGGTGFYIDSLLFGLEIPEVPPNDELRRSLANKSPQELFTILKQLDPIRAKTIDAKNPVRLIRAIEITKKLGSVPQLHKTKQNYDILWIGINPGKEKLIERIHNRLIKRIKKGMINEAKTIHKNGLSWKRMEELGLEYKWLAFYLQNFITKDEMISKLEKDIIQYSKRQMTWFKKNKDIIWIDTNKKRNEKQLLSIVKSFLTKK